MYSNDVVSTGKGGKTIISFMGSLIQLAKVSIDTLEGDALKAELNRLQEKLEHQRNLARLRGARYYAKHGKIKDPADRKNPVANLSLNIQMI
jgi:hypothetical protein